MIQTRGYYLDNPRYYEDFVGGNKVIGFHHYAYYFKNDGSFLKGYKRNDKTEEFFKREDFLEDQKNRYEILENNKLKLIFNYDKEWEHEQTLSIFNENILCNVERVLRFIPF